MTNKDQAEKLKPCPFCGGEIDTDLFGGKGRNGIEPALMIDCCNPDCFLAQYSRGGPKPYDEFDELAKAWNTRAQLEAEPAYGEALRAWNLFSYKLDHEGFIKIGVEDICRLRLHKETIRRALTQAQGCNVPDGWRLVPVTPTDEWQDINTAPRDKLILMCPKFGAPFVGDIWSRDCKRRHDIEEDELVRIRLPNGVIWTCKVEQMECWQPLPAAPQPDKGE